VADAISAQVDRSWSTISEVDYDAAGRLTLRYGDFCKSRGIPFQHEDHIRPYDTTTLFCPAGMQQFKARFKDPGYRGTQANIQACLRLSDLDEIGDGSHLLNFDMLGLFSFREMSLADAVGFWFGFLAEIGVAPDVVTLHPDRLDDWRPLYAGRPVEIRADDGCVWSDGDIGGYCTEFYRDGVEIGNIVNTNGDCIDVGFGLDRLAACLGEPPVGDVEALERAVLKIIASGYRPGAKQQGYVLRKLLREVVRRGGKVDHPVFHEERARQARLQARYERLRTKHADKPPEWWFDTHGIDPRDFD
jgi:alanyl-tRNA synthetase